MIRYSNRTELAFVSHYVFLQSKHKTLGVLWGKNNTTANLSLRHTRQDTRKIYNKITRPVGNNSKVSILPLSHLLREFYLQVLLIVIIIIHNFKI